MIMVGAAGSARRDARAGGTRARARRPVARKAPPAPRAAAKTLRDFPIGTRGRWIQKDGAFLFFHRAAEPVLRLKAPKPRPAPRAHGPHNKFDAPCLARADPATVLAGARGSWGVFAAHASKESSGASYCEQHPFRRRCRNATLPIARPAPGRGSLAIMTFVPPAAQEATRAAPAPAAVTGALGRLWRMSDRREQRDQVPAARGGHSPWVLRKGGDGKLGRVEAYLHREAALFQSIARAIDAAPGPARVLDIGANHGLFAISAALRGARVAAVEAQATLASIVKVAALANGVDVDVFHNAILDVPAVVEISELGAANEVNEGGTASLGAKRDGVRMVKVSTASVDLVARESFGTEPIDFLKIDVEGVEIPALRSTLGLLGRGGVRETSIEFGPARRWEEPETHGVAGANPTAATDVLRRIAETGYDAYLMIFGKCVPALNSTGGLAAEVFARENQLALVKRGGTHPCHSPSRLYCCGGALRPPGCTNIHCNATA